MDVEEMKAAYRRAVGDGVTHGSALFGLEAAKERLLRLLDAGDRLVRALEKNADLDDPDVKEALAEWEAVR